MKIHCVEGLASFYFRPLTKAVQSLNLKVEVVTYPWTVKEIPVEDGDICCFHSFGLRAFKMLNFRKKNIYFILDGRMPPWGTSLGYPVPFNEKVYNYYQTGFVQGYSIGGAQNLLIKGLSHIRIPRNPAFLFKLMEVVKSQN